MSVDSHCERCGRDRWDAMDVRFGFCPHCIAFTSAPTDFIVSGGMTDEEQEAWDRKVLQSALAARVRAPFTVYTEEEKRDNWQRNRVAFLIEERMALAVQRPAGFALVNPDGSLDYTPLPPKSLWRRIEDWAYSRWITRSMEARLSAAR